MDILISVSKTEDFFGYTIVDANGEPLGELESFEKHHVHKTLTGTVKTHSGHLIHHVNLKGAKIYTQDQKPVPAIEDYKYVRLKSLSAEFEQKIVGLISKVPEQTRSSKGNWLVHVQVSIPFGTGKADHCEYFFKKPEAVAFIKKYSHKMVASEHVSTSNGNVAQTIIRQIQALDKMALLAWGAKNYVSLTDPVFDKPEIGKGVKFTVRGPKFKGQILILLTPQDLYDVFAFTVRKLETKLKFVERGIHVDNLVTVIDNIVG